MDNISLEISFKLSYKTVDHVRNEVKNQWNSLNFPSRFSNEYMPYLARTHIYLLKTLSHYH